MPNIEFNFDRISFWLGFLAACLFWWLVGQIRPRLPHWRKQVRQYFDAIKQRNFSGVDNHIRRETLRTAQKHHLAACLFSLDEVALQPFLMLPPAGHESGAQDGTHSISSQVIPYLPDWPELVTRLGVPVVTPLEALKSGRNLVFIGQPGSGKTFALAHLASALARTVPTEEHPAPGLPLYLHILALIPSMAEGTDPLETLIKAVTSTATVVMQPQISRYLRSIARNKGRKVALLIDGLDELPGEQLKSAVVYLQALMAKHPEFQIIVTASGDMLDGLLKIGFYPLPVAGWSQSERAGLVQKWDTLWNEQILPEAKKRAGVNEVEPAIISNWLNMESAPASPLEWTLRVWGAYAGDLSGSHPVEILEAHLKRFLPSPNLLPSLTELARSMLLETTPCLGFDDMDEFLSNAKFNHSALISVDKPQVKAGDHDAPGILPGEHPTGKDEKRKKTRRDITVSAGEQILEALISGGILVEMPDHRVRFASPLFLGYLGGMKLSRDEAGEISRSIDWPVQLIALRTAAACDDNPEWIYKLIENPTPPLFQPMLVAARWLCYAPPAAEWRGYLMHNLVGQIQNELLPLGARARIAAAFYLSRDPSTAKLFRQLLTSKSPSVRRVALMGCGALGNPQLINAILPLLADSQLEVRHTACLALAAIPGEPALKAVVEMLLSGDDDIRQAAAESLAMNIQEGQKILEEAATVNDLMTRRAAVFGLLTVKETWARKLLEKIAVEDGQWVVRNAAAQALEVIQIGQPGIPKRLSAPSEAGWLITFASKFGMGVLPGQPATDVLLRVLKSGSLEEQIAALQYLRDHPDEGIIKSIYDLLYSGQAELSEPVLLALWWIAVSGVKLPAPAQFGLG